MSEMRSVDTGLQWNWRHLVSQRHVLGACNATIVESKNTHLDLNPPFFASQITDRASREPLDKVSRLAALHEFAVSRVVWRHRALGFDDSTLAFPLSFVFRLLVSLFL